MTQAERAFSLLLGFLLLGSGLYALTLEHPLEWWRAVAGLMLVLLGGNSLYAGCRGIRSWLSHIGPLP